MDKNFLPQNVWDRLDLGPQLWPTKRPSAMWIYAINCFVNKANAKEPPLLSWAVGQMVWWGKSQKADAAATFVLWGAMWVMHEFKWCHFIGTTCCEAPKMRNGICFSTLHGALNLHLQPADAFCRCSFFGRPTWRMLDTILIYDSENEIFQLAGRAFP